MQVMRVLLFIVLTGVGVSANALSIEGKLAPGEEIRLPLNLSAGEYQRGRISSNVPLADARILNPNGKVYKQLLLHPASTLRYQLVAEEAGSYAISLVAGEKTAHYRLRGEAIEATLNVQSKLESPRLHALAEKLAEGGDTGSFWREIEANGSPMVEEHPLDSSLRWVTFLWRGDNDNVRLFTSLPGERHPYLKRLDGTDVWYRTFALPHDSRLSYQMVPDTPRLPDPEGKNRIAILANAQLDPLNKERWVFHARQDRFSTDSTLTLPGAKSSPWLAPRNVPSGVISQHQLHSDILDNNREISLYRPAGIYTKDRQQPLPLLFFFDSLGYRSKVPTPQILDNLIAAGKIPPSIAVFIANPSRESRARELPCNADFARFMAQELLPWVTAETGNEATASRTLLAGSSYGGLAAACTAYRYPEQFGQVLSLSGSFWWAPEFGQTETFEPEWLNRQYATAETKPIRFFLSAGRFETGWQPSDILPSNRHLRDLLIAKGYDVTYEEVSAGHDYFSWREILPLGLITLLGDRDEQVGR